MKEHPAIKKIDSEKGECFCCKENTKLIYIDLEIQKEDNGKFCAACLKLVAMADYNLNRTPGICRP
jgi:hypothetical protein